MLKNSVAEGFGFVLFCFLTWRYFWIICSRFFQTHASWKFILKKQQLRLSNHLLKNPAKYQLLGILLIPVFSLLQIRHQNEASRLYQKKAKLSNLFRDKLDSFYITYILMCLYTPDWPKKHEKLLAICVALISFLCFHLSSSCHCELFLGYWHLSLGQGRHHIKKNCTD